ncbi:MAG: site-specific integrase [Victivallales bacterium]
MIFTRPNSPNYYIRLYSGGRERWLSLRTDNKKEAQKRAARIKYTILPKVLRMAMDKPPLTIDEIKDEYLKSQKFARLKESTAEMNLLTLDKFLQFCKKRHAKSTKDINEYLAGEYMASLDVASKTHNNQKITLSAIWKAIREDNIWAEVESKALKTVPMRKFTEDEIKAIMLNVSFDPFWRPACTIALYTGLRFEDIVFLGQSQVKKEMRFIELPPKKTERTGRSVYIPLHPIVQTELKRVRASGEHYFSEELKIYREHRGTLPKQFHRILEDLKITRNSTGRVGFHSWRVTFASKAEDDGIPRETIRAILGHTTMLMSRHYIDNPESLNLDDLKEVKISS